MSRNTGRPTVAPSRRTESIDTDRLFSALRNPRARRALAVLSEHEGPMAVADLAEEVAAGARPVFDDPAETVEGVSLDLHHGPVPKLADAGVVEYDRSRGVASLSADAADLTELLGAFARR